MQEQTKSTEELFRELAPESQKEARMFIEFLIAKQEARPADSRSLIGLER